MKAELTGMDVAFASAAFKRLAETSATSKCAASADLIKVIKMCKSAQKKLAKAFVSEMTFTELEITTLEGLMEHIIAGSPHEKDRTRAKDVLLKIRGLQ